MVDFQEAVLNLAKLYFGVGIIYKTNFIWNTAFIPNTTLKMFKIVRPLM